jgi:hypothetical protein
VTGQPRPGWCSICMSGERAPDSDKCPTCLRSWLSRQPEAVRRRYTLPPEPSRRPTGTSTTRTSTPELAAALIELGDTPRTSRCSEHSQKGG